MQVQTGSQEVSHRADTIAAHRQAAERVIRAMRTHLDEALSLDDMAEIALCSPYHFNRVFRDVVGIPPSQFLYALRLQRAKRLLLTTDLSVTEICFTVGYNSLGSFIQRFTELVGVSPTRLRRLAEDEGLFSNLEAFCRQMALPPPLPLQPKVSGRIATRHGFAGPIFIGLFSKHIPQGRPAGGTLLTEPGPFQILETLPGRYYLFAAGFDWPAPPMGYLLPDESRLQVGVSRRPVQVGHGTCTRAADVILRPVTLTDPPILIALPLLLAEHLAAQGQGPESSGASVEFLRET